MNISVKNQETMQVTDGTPKNMEQAIVNGLNAAGGAIDSQTVVIIRKHIDDFIRQKFAIGILQNVDQESLLLEIMYRLVVKGEGVK